MAHGCRALCNGLDKSRPRDHAQIKHEDGAFEGLARSVACAVVAVARRRPQGNGRLPAGSLLLATKARTGAGGGSCGVECATRAVPTTAPERLSELRPSTRSLRPRAIRPQPYSAAAAARALHIAHSATGVAIADHAHARIRLSCCTAPNRHRRSLCCVLVTRPSRAAANEAIAIGGRVRAAIEAAHGGSAEPRNRGRAAFPEPESLILLIRRSSRQEWSSFGAADRPRF